MSLEACVACVSDISLKHISLSKSCRQTAARELRPDDIVLDMIDIHNFIPLTMHTV